MAAILTPIQHKKITDLLGQLNSQPPNSPSHHAAMNPVTITQDQLSSIFHTLQTTMSTSTILALPTISNR
jgi:hypothetical protein